MHKNAIKINIQNIYHRLPLFAWIIIAVIINLSIVYSLVFFIPKNVQFSYAGETCVNQLSLFPSVQKDSSDEFEVKTKDELKLGSFTYGTSKVCVTPKQIPQEGTYTAQVSLFGSWFATKHFNVEVPSPPVAHKADLIDKAVSAALPLRIGLSGADTVHTYSLSIADKAAKCKTEDSDLVCAIADLELKPGTEYTASLVRSFNNEDSKKVIEGKIETLLPIVMQEASINEAKVFYDSPKEFSFTFDKDVESAEVLLEKKVGDAREKVPTSTRSEGTKLYVTTSSDLARKADFSLTLQQVVAKTGNSLDAPISINFTTSGGPKPSGVSVGTTGVSQTAQIIVSLDQPIKEDTDISKLARVTGVSGTVSQRSATELVYSINAGLCEAFSLIFDKGIASATNSEVSEAWKFDGRTICGTSSVIGYSTKGRAITAYYFGNGNTTIMFTGGMHGSEPSGYTTMQAWVTYLMSNGYKIPADKRVVIVPNTNPDGIAAGSRNSATNVNIDRNFPTANWKANIETASGVLVNGGGVSGGSEPETKALMALTRQLRPRLEVSFHSQGRLVGANKFGDSVSIGGIYSSLTGYKTMFYDAEAVMGYPMTGEYEDWMGEALGTPAILIELPSSSGNYLNANLNALMRMLTV
jgi:protein MpaA